MSFQHFRLGELSLHQPLPPHLQPPIQQPAASHFPPQLPASFPPAQQKGPTSTSPTKQPYGSGDTDDGYTLVFPNIDAFNEWRAAEEEQHVVEFVKGDTHGSKAVPPRFKDHTKLVCARHSRSGRKKYIKKHPDRVRKVPSRKLEGVGCPASISYKTYFDTEEVRACYIAQHSHETGAANLPYTRRGRKAAVQHEKEHRKSLPADGNASASNATISGNTNPPAANVATTSTAQPVYAPSVPMMPLPQHYPPPPPQPYSYAAPLLNPYQPPPAQGFPQERWDNMVTLFNSVREHARGFEYPLPSVTTLETVLIRLYLESPVGVGGAVIQNGARQSAPQGSTQGAGNAPNGNNNANGEAS